jgi:hypothetical protein
MNGRKMHSSRFPQLIALIKTGSPYRHGFEKIFYSVSGPGGIGFTG